MWLERSRALKSSSPGRCAAPLGCCCFARGHQPRNPVDDFCRACEETHTQLRAVTKARRLAIDRTSRGTSRSAGPAAGFVDGRRRRERGFVGAHTTTWNGANSQPAESRALGFNWPLILREMELVALGCRNRANI